MLGLANSILKRRSKTEKKIEPSSLAPIVVDKTAQADAELIKALCKYVPSLVLNHWADLKSQRSSLENQIK